MSGTKAFSLCTILLVSLLITARGYDRKNSTYPTPYSCQSPSGKTVEWFISLKMPNGYNYIYMDSQNFQDWQLPTDGIDNARSPLMRTLASVKEIDNTHETRPKGHESTPKFGSIFWNDQPPGTTASKDSKAHSKGVMGFDEHTGFLLIHSTPRFPTVSGSNGRVDDQTVDDTLSKNQTIYGQHFFCITMDTEELNNVAKAYLINDVYVYAGAVPQFLRNKYPNLSNILYNKYQRLKETGFSLKFKSLFANFNFTIFAQSLAYVAPLYNDVVVPAMGSGIRTETWGNGVSKLEDPVCRGVNDSIVSNVEVNVKGKYVYQSTNDHSKYGISMDPNNPYVCLGDINRQESQYRRGGGTVCFVNQKIWNNFNNIMVQSQDCAATNLMAEKEELGNTWSSQVKQLLFANQNEE